MFALRTSPRRLARNRVDYTIIGDRSVRVIVLRNQASPECEPARFVDVRPEVANEHGVLTAAEPDPTGSQDTGCGCSRKILEAT
jgi:hypothetical protein